MKLGTIAWGMWLLAAPALGEVYVFQGEAVDIPESGPANPSFIHIEGFEGVAQRVEVRLYGMSHNYTSETMVALSNPNGVTTLLFEAPRCRMTGIDITFADDAENLFENSCRDGALVSGAYTTGPDNDRYQFTIPIAPLHPFSETLADLILPDMNGRWILWSEDFVGGDGGQIDSWELIIETADDPSVPPDDSDEPPPEGGDSDEGALFEEY